MKWLRADVLHHLSPAGQLPELRPAHRLGAQEALVEGEAFALGQFALNIMVTIMVTVHFFSS